MVLLIAGGCFVWVQVGWIAKPTCTPNVFTLFDWILVSKSHLQIKKQFCGSLAGPLI